ncbi:MAG: hypothetical protein IPL78_22730 [Chloroflexi bacterium]|nr:hypothetical protein [Chloroflexota bacterium]
MWNEIVRIIAQYDSAVLTVVDAGGFPFSGRCVPQPDEARQVIRVTLPPDAFVQPGPASLMSHAHDDQMWNLRGYNVVGELEREGEGWVLRPRRLLPGLDTGNMLAQIKMLFKSRRAAQQYLDKRNLPRPKIDWAGIKRLHVEARKKK